MTTDDVTILFETICVSDTIRHDTKLSSNATQQKLYSEVDCRSTVLSFQWHGGIT